MAKIEECLGTGRRKRAVASVWVRPGSGNIQVNGRPFIDYFPLKVQQEAILEPLKKAGLDGSKDLLLRVRGGGIEGQATAARLGVARALVSANEDLRARFKDEGYLTRDPRKRERKKYGLAGARKRFQFSKR